MTIGDLSRRTGVAQSALRYYERIGLMRSPGRVGGRRVYDPQAVTQVDVISAARELGFGVNEIRTLVDSRSATSITDRWRALAQRKLPEMDSLIDRATRMKQMLHSGLTCGCAKIEDCLLHGCVPSSAPQLIQIQVKKKP